MEQDKTLREFWSLVRDTWDTILTGDRPFVEKPPGPGFPSRYFRMADIEEDYYARNLKDAGTRAAAQAEISKLIHEYRAN